LGEKFGLPWREQDKERTIIEFIKHIEKNIFRCHEQIGSSIRSQAIPIINRILDAAPKSNYYHKMLLHWLDFRKKFVKSHPEIMFTKTDKGNATVAIGKIDYYKKMEELLSKKKHL